MAHLSRRRRSRGTLGSLAIAVSLVGTSVAVVGGIGSLARNAVAELPVPLPPELTPRPAAPPTVDPAQIEPSESGYVAQGSDRRRHELTLDPALQVASERLLDQPGVEQASAVLLSVEDGRILALAGRSQAEPHAPSLATIPWAPAASIFKVVTAAALVESGAQVADERVCYHGGVHSVEADNLQARPRLDSQCASLAFGLAKSQNAILARLADEHLVPSMLTEMAERFGWNRAPVGDVVALPSSASIPEARLPFARTAAGFWSTTLSPLHGAVLAATIARGGTTPPVHLIERTIDENGDVAVPARPESARVIDAATAQKVGAMLVGTTEYGTAKRGFHDERGRQKLPGVRVAGKTGTLSRALPYRGYSWFVGYAPAERPEVAVAILVGNGEHSNLRAHQLAAKLLQTYFNGAPTLVASR